MFSHRSGGDHILTLVAALHIVVQKAVGFKLLQRHAAQKPGGGQRFFQNHINTRIVVAAVVPDLFALLADFFDFVDVLNIFFHLWAPYIDQFIHAVGGAKIAVVHSGNQSQTGVKFFDFGHQLFGGVEFLEADLVKSVTVSSIHQSGFFQHGHCGFKVV